MSCTTEGIVWRENGAQNSHLSLVFPRLLSFRYDNFNVRWFIDGRTLLTANNVSFSLSKLVRAPFIVIRVGTSALHMHVCIL